MSPSTKSFPYAAPPAATSASSASVRVQVWDATGNKRQDVEMPADAPVNRILAVLLEKMKFPRYAPDGQPLSYKFHHRASGKQLLDEQTLSDVGVKDGDVLRLQPEITAGRSDGGRGSEDGAEASDAATKRRSDEGGG